jgi:hypothetical protein
MISLTEVAKHVRTNNKIIMPGGGCKSLTNEGAVRLNSGGAEPGSVASGGTGCFASTAPRDHASWDVLVGRVGFGSTGKFRSC